MSCFWYVQLTFLLFVTPTGMGGWASMAARGNFSKLSGPLVAPPSGDARQEGENDTSRGIFLVGEGKLLMDLGSFADSIHS